MQRCRCATPPAGAASRSSRSSPSSFAAAAATAARRVTTALVPIQVSDDLDWSPEHVESWLFHGTRRQQQRRQQKQQRDRARDRKAPL